MAVNNKLIPITLLVAVAWEPDYIAQGDNGMELVKPRYVMPTVAYFHNLLNFPNVVFGAN